MLEEVQHTADPPDTFVYNEQQETLVAKATWPLTTLLYLISVGCCVICSTTSPAASARHICNTLGHLAATPGPVTLAHVRPEWAVPNHGDILIVRRGQKARHKPLKHRWPHLLRPLHPIYSCQHLAVIHRDGLTSWSCEERKRVGKNQKERKKPNTSSNSYMCW